MRAFEQELSHHSPRGGTHPHPTLPRFAGEEILSFNSYAAGRGRARRCRTGSGWCEIGRDLVEARLAELAFDVVFLGEAEAAVGLQAGLGGGPRGLGGEQLGDVGLVAAGLAGVEQSRQPSRTIRSAARICA